YTRITAAKHHLLNRKIMASAALFFVFLALATMQSQTASSEKETHLKVYWHDVVSGPDPTSVPVAQAATTNTSKTAFGMVMVIDDPLSEGPGLNSSRLMGRAQGTYIAAGNDQLALLMNMNFVFTAGKYNGSSVAIMGRNAVFTKVREMAIIGGTGVFRWARGYAQARTHTLDLMTGDATVEYNIFIRH
uniref:Dirigent protein n=2 Tax=Aegilops tauschii TaxID=37682 RepID=A0A453GMM2_AEGTS